MTVLQNAIAKIREEILDSKNQNGLSKTAVQNYIDSLPNYSGWGTVKSDLVHIIYDYATGNSTESQLAATYPTFNNLNAEIRSWILGTNVRPFIYSPVSPFINNNDISELGTSLDNGVKFVTSVSDHHFGYEIAVCDLDGDGDSHIIFSSNHDSDSDNGYVYLLNDIENFSAETDISSSASKTISNTGSGVIGHIEDCKDLDNDGNDDLVVYAGNDVHVFFGSTSLGSTSSASIDLNDDPADDTISDATNGNGAMAKFTGGDVDDLILVASDGESLLIKNYDDPIEVAVSLPATPDDASAVRVQNLGDVNGDGKDDLAVWGDSEDAVLVIYGNSNPDSLDLSSIGNEGDDTGFVIMHYGSINYVGNLPGDFDKDGTNDVLISTTGGDQHVDFAELFIVYGSDSPENTIILGSSSTQEYTYIYSGYGLYHSRYHAYAKGFADLNNDGYGDAIISYEDFPAERVSVLYGSNNRTVDFNLDDITDSTNRAGFVINGGSDALGASIKAVDWNQDGIQDLLIGAPANSIFSSEDPAAYLFLS